MNKLRSTSPMTDPGAYHFSSILCFLVFNQFLIYKGIIILLLFFHCVSIWAREAARGLLGVREQMLHYPVFVEQWWPQWVSSDLCSPIEQVQNQGDTEHHC